MKKFDVLIDEKSLNNRIQEIAKQIEKDYENEEIVFVCILKGAVYFAVELTKQIKNNVVELDFMKVNSYNNQLETTGKIDFQLDTHVELENKNVIIVEDIIDSGYTLNFLHSYLQKKNPKSLKICVLLDKEERRKQPIKIDYTGFKIEDKFVVGFGMDYEDKYRNLPYIGYLS